jgi:hypothetical protein
MSQNSSNLGSLIYGDLTVFPGYDTSSAGFGNLYVSGASSLVGNTSLGGGLTVTSGASFNSSVTVTGSSTFNGPATFTSGTTTSSVDMLVSSTTNSTSTTSGALQVRGGVGISKNAWIGGIIDVAGNSSLHGTLSVTSTSTFNGAVSVAFNSASTSPTTGSLVIAGGIGIGGDIQSGTGNLYLNSKLVINSDGTSTFINPGTAIFINTGGVNDVNVNSGSSAIFNVAGVTNTSSSNGLQVLTTTDSSSSTTGVLTVAGGAGVAKNLYVGQGLYVSGSLNLSGVFNISNTTQSTSTSTGAVTISGGVGIIKNAFIGGIVDTAAISGNQSWLGSVGFTTGTGSSGNIINSGDLSRAGWQTLYFGSQGGVGLMNISSTSVHINTTTASVSSSTGGLVVAGGAGVGGDLYLGATLNVTGTSNFGSNLNINGNSIYLDPSAGQTSYVTYNSGVAGPIIIGNTGGALGTSTGSVLYALTWDASQSVQVYGTANSSSSSTGALTVSGGAGIVKDLHVGGNVYINSGTSLVSTNGNNLFVNATGDSVVIRNNSGSSAGQFESSPTFFNFSTIGVTPYVTFSIDKTSGYVLVNQTDNATAVGSGSFQVSGGGSVAKNFYIGGDQFVTGNSTISGNLLVSGTISTTGNSPVTFSNTTNSTSTTTGGVIISGGLGIAENAYVGGLLVVTNTTASTSSTTGAFQLAGGAGIQGAVYLGSTLNVTSTSTFGGAVHISDTTVSTSPTTGSLTVAGGVGILGNIYTSGLQFFQNTTQSTSISNGALVVSGGVGIAGNINSSGVLSITNTTGSTSSSTGATIIAGGVGIGENLFVGNNVSIGGNLSVTGSISSTSGVNFTNTTDSTSPTTGSVTIAGGLGVSKALYVGSTIQSTSSSTGGLVLSGGLGVSGNVYSSGILAFDSGNAAPLLKYNNAGLAAPTFITESAGTKIILWNALSATAVDFSIGTNTNDMWIAIPQNNATYTTTWYGGVTQIMQLSGAGLLSIFGTAQSTSTITGALTVSGGVGATGNAFIGGLLNVASTGYFGGAITAASTITASGTVSVNNSTNSSTFSNGAITTTGGLGVTLNANIGGSLGVSSNASITGTLGVGGIVSISDTTESTSTINGSLIVSGGAGIAKNLNVGNNMMVGGNATISGNLTVNGTYTTVNSQSLTTLDPIILVNSGPAGTVMSGLAMKRYQYANDSGLGDVVSGDLPAEITGTCPSTGTSTTIILASSASAIDTYYNGYWLKITSGTGINEVRRIKTYVGASRTATIETTAEQTANNYTPVEGLDFTVIPNNTSVYALYGETFIVTLYDEANATYNIGASPINPELQATVPIRYEIPIVCGSMKITNPGGLQVNNINAYSGSAVTIEGMTVTSSGVLSGVTSINGNTPDSTSTVQLLDNDITSHATIPGTHQGYGAYSVLVQGVNTSGTSAVFLICSNTSRGGMVSRMVSSVGTNSESLTITWSQAEYPQLTWLVLPNNGTGLNITYNIKVTAL